MLKYIKYFWYVVKHKWFVLLECWKEGLYWQGIIHDNSKFSKAEFGAYARYFYGSKKQAAGPLVKEKFDEAWKHHYQHNPHHWDYYLYPDRITGEEKAAEMPKKYAKEMVCDWRGMGRVFGDSAADFYKLRKHGIALNVATRMYVEELLGIYR